MLRMVLDYGLISTEDGKEIQLQMGLTRVVCKVVQETWFPCSSLS